MLPPPVALDSGKTHCWSPPLVKLPPMVLVWPTPARAVWKPGQVSPPPATVTPPAIVPPPPNTLLRPTVTPPAPVALPAVLLTINAPL